MFRAETFFFLVDSSEFEDDIGRARVTSRSAKSGSGEASVGPEGGGNQLLFPY